MVNGVPKVYRGSLALISADNLASNALGGFKGSGSAFRHCRQCLGTKDEIKIQVKEICMVLSC